MEWLFYIFKYLVGARKIWLKLLKKKGAVAKAAEKVEKAKGKKGRPSVRYKFITTEDEMKQMSLMYDKHGYKTMSKIWGQTVWSHLSNDEQNKVREEFQKTLAKNERAIYLHKAHQKARALLKKQQNGQELTTSQKQFLDDYEEMMVKVIANGQKPNKWNMNDLTKMNPIHSSWLIMGRFACRKGAKVGTFQCIMIRGGGKVYSFPHFPKRQYLALLACDSHAGTYFHRKNLWKYSRNAHKRRLTKAAVSNTADLNKPQKNPYASRATHLKNVQRVQAKGRKPPMTTGNYRFAKSMHEANKKPNAYSKQTHLKNVKKVQKKYKTKKGGKK